MDEITLTLMQETRFPAGTCDMKVALRELPLVGRYPGWQSHPCDLPEGAEPSVVCAQKLKPDCKKHQASSAVPLRGQRRFGKIATLSERSFLLLPV